MHFEFKLGGVKSLILLLSTAMLAACGGSSGSSDDTSLNTQSSQSKQLVRSVKAASTASGYQNVVQELYIAYFGRPADPSGLSNFEAQLQAAGAPSDMGNLVAAYQTNATVKNVIDNMGGSGESNAMYGSGSTQDFVTAVFQNVVGRAPSASGLAFWQSSIDSGSVTKAAAAVSIMAGALGNQTAQGKVDAQLIANRLTVSEYFTSQLSARNVSVIYNGNSAATTARAMLTAVTATTDTTAYQSNVNATIATLTATSPAASGNGSTSVIAGTDIAQMKVAATVQATTTLATPAYFVSPNGNNANPGSQAYPWRTLSYATSRLRPGDTLYAMGGSYDELVTVWVSGTATAPITITNYPGQSPVIDGWSLTVPSYSSLVQLTGNYITFSGFELRNINLDGHGGHGGSAVVYGGYGANITGTHDTFANLLVHQIWEQGILASGDYATIQDSTVHMVALANCRTAGVANCSTTQRAWPSCVSVASPYNSGKITHYPTIQRNTVYNCWGEGISSWLTDSATIQDNVVYDNWAENLYVNNVTNAMVQRNLVYNTPNNYVNARSGFALADEVTTTVAGQTNPLSSHNTVINNLVYNAQFCAYCWTDVANSGLNNVLIANNTIVNPVGTSSFATGSTASAIPVVNTNSTIVNNIVVGIGSVPVGTGLTLSNNLWSVKPTGVASGPGDVIGDPKLAANVGTGPGQLTTAYFQLQTGSPAIGAGKSLTQVVADIVGTLVSGAPDIGAF